MSRQSPHVPKRSPAERAALQQKVNEIWPNLGPLPWLKVLENAVLSSSKFDAKAQESIRDLVNMIRSELRERSAQTEAEMQLLRFMRGIDLDGQRELLKLLLEGGGMETPAVEAYVAALNFETLGKQAVAR